MESKVLASVERHRAAVGLERKSSQPAANSSASQPIHAGLTPSEEGPRNKTA